MRSAPKNQIELALVSNKIAITLWSEDGHCVRTRRISLKNAADLSLLLDGGAFPWALNFEVDAGVTLQIENLPYERAWICISEEPPNTGRDLNASVEGVDLTGLGRLLDVLLVAASRSSAMTNNVVYVRPVEHCYLDDGFWP